MYQQPQQPQPDPPRRRRKWPWVLGGLATLMIVMFGGCAVVLIGVDDALDETPTDVDDAAEGDPADGSDGNDADDSDGDEVDDETRHIGDTVAMGDLEHTLHAARWDEGDEFLGPDEGERWLVVDVELANSGDESEAISSMAMWDLVDQENRSADLALTDGEGQMDGELGAGREMRGEIAFSVPDNGNEFELIFEPNLFGFGQTIYEITTDDVQ